MNQTIFILARGQDRRISRKDIVLVAANKDGGAHVDAKLTPQYESLKQRGGTLLSFDSNIGGEFKKVEFENIHELLIRQMVYELLNSPALLALSRD